MSDKPTRYYSNLQESHVSNFLDGRIVPGSGGTKFNGGDVVVDDILIECKTTTSDKSSFSIKKQWIDKVTEQSFAQRCSHWAIAFRFSPEGKDYYVLDESEFLNYIAYKREVESKYE